MRFVEVITTICHAFKDRDVSWQDFPMLLPRPDPQSLPEGQQILSSQVPQPAHGVPARERVVPELGGLVVARTIFLLVASGTDLLRTCPIP